jgi:hypothetical protein
VLIELQHIMSESLRATLSQETQVVRQVQEMQSQMIVGFRRGLRPQDDDGVNSNVVRIVCLLKLIVFIVSAGASLRISTTRHASYGRRMVAESG